jgi:hypothetical protein
MLAAQERPPNPDAQALIDFRDRVDQYIALRNKADDAAPPLEKTADSEKIHAAQLALATRVRAARPSAKHGDIFTPAVAAVFRRALRPEAKEEGTKDAILKEDNPAFPLKVNDAYPDKEPLSTVPPNVLESLPKLPEKSDLEYRFVKKHLILRDARANLIVDYIPNALP